MERPLCCGIKPQIGGIKWQSYRFVLPTADVIAKWQTGYLNRWANKSCPPLFADLTPEQQVELHRHVNDLAISNKLASAPED